MAEQPSLTPLNGSIHGIYAYKIFAPTFNLTTAQAFIPFLYIGPTIVIMITILVKYRKAKAAMHSAAMDQNIFAFIMFYFLFNTLFYVGDYFHLILPTTGLITASCADIQPNRLFTMLLIYAYACNFGVIICPFMVCLMRLTIMMSPRHNERYCRLIMYRFSIPFLFFVPIVLTAFNVTTTGFCKQLHAPFAFGSLIIYEGEEFAKVNIHIHFCFSCIIFVANVGMSVFMFYKLRVTQGNTTSMRTKELTRKAEFSLFLVVVSSIVPFITNSICSITFLFNRPYWYRVLFLRSIGNDYETTIMPWVLFLTHPMFRQKKQHNSVSTASNVLVTSNKTTRSQPGNSCFKILVNGSTWPYKKFCKARII